MSRLTKQECAKLRTDLRDLGYGQAETEAPDIFARRLYPVPEHLRALVPSVVLVVGPRGSGKSAMFKAFFESGDLGSSIVQHASETVRLRNRSNSTTWKPAYPVKADEIDPRVWKQLRPMVEPPAAALGTVFEAERKLRANPTAAIDLLEKRLEHEDRWLFVGYDELDTIGGSDWELMARLVRGLVAFWSDYGRRWQRIRAKIFLRSDLFRRHTDMGTANFAKLAANRSELEWSDADILGMLVKRIANTSVRLADYCRRARISFTQDEALGLLPKIEKPGDAYPLLERFAGEFMGAGRKKGYVRNWVLDHLRDGNAQISPRTLVRAERPEQLVDYLVELGVFRRRWDDRIDVPDLYLFGLDLRRKSGVSRRVS